MSYKSLLVHVDSTPRAAARLNIAIALARRFEAHLTALFVAPDPLPMFAMAGDVPSNLLALDVESAAKQARATFENLTSAAGMANVEWREAIGAPIDDLCLHARYHDLVVVGQADPQQMADGLTPDLPQNLALAARRPVLVIPYTGSFETVWKHALVGWNARPEAIRAVTDALPLLKLASRTTVLSVNPEIGSRLHGEQPGADLALYLARHGVRAEASTVTAYNDDAGNVLLSRAADLGADLIVMGAYGHSRLRELVLGGATRTILQSMTVPVLLSH